MNFKITIFLLILNLSFSPFSYSETYKKIQWVELMPKEDAEALYNPPEVLLDIPEEIESKISKGVLEALLQAQDSDYQNALTSRKVIKELNKQKINIPGYVVPVVIDGDKTTEFFIVPYYGACLHYPPPPPNQTIYAVYEKGFSLSDMFEPFSFKGEIVIATKKLEIAESAYTLNISSINIFEE